MKIRKLFLLATLFIFASLFLFACSGGFSDAYPMPGVLDGEFGFAEDGYAVDAATSKVYGDYFARAGVDVSSYYHDGAYDFSGVTSEEMDELIGEARENINQIMAGQLTASAYDDNLHFEFWQSLLRSGQTEEENGIFYEYANKFVFNLKNRIKITVPSDLTCVISLKDGKNTKTITPNKEGIAYFYPESEAENYLVTVNYFKNGEALKEEATVSGDYEFTLEGDNLAKDAIELMVVLDTTGSMGDEIRYLQVEIDNVIDRVKEQNPNTKIRLAVLVYRDKGDIYVTKYSDFSDDISVGRSFLEQQSAGGGGDFEEAVEVALKEAASKDWSNETTTKIILHVADAPAHDGKIDEWNKVCYSLASKGIRIINVASSGIDKKTEYFFRCECLITNGIYTYLTNDSGIGGDHIDATTEDSVTVELLNSMLVRLISGMHTGDFGTPINYLQEISVEE